MQPENSASRLTLRLFGPFEARCHGELLPRMRTRKGHWLLALLALRHGAAVDRDWLATLLWPDSSPAAALTNLRGSLKDLRRALGPEADRLCSPTSRGLCLDLADADIDVATFDAAVVCDPPFAGFGEAARRRSTTPPDARGASAPTSRLKALETAVALYRGPLLEECAEAWILQERQAREQAYLGALEALASAALTHGDAAAAERHLRRAVATDPLRESARRALMRALAAGGNTTAAIQVYQDLRIRLHRELGGEPDPETVSLFRQLRGDAQRSARLPASLAASPREQDRTAPLPPDLIDTRPGRPPAPPTALIGRDRELTHIRALLQGEAPRLLTLTGPGGIGKTRLALEAATLPEAFPDGVVFVDLAPLRQPDLLSARIAAAVGVHETGRHLLLEELKEHLRGQRLLLLLDNFEQILPAAPVVAELMAAAPGLKLLVTSRAALRLRGEQEFALPPLALPNRSERPPLAALSRYAAVDLFIQRARDINPQFAVTHETAPAVAEICHRLDGLPLAIELAAARTRLLSPAELLRRLESRLKLLVAGPRDLPARQQTLRATIAWSHDLLGAAEKRLFPRLAVFAGGWSLEAVEAVCADDAGSTVLEGLESLAAQSLVQRETSGDGQARFGMLETIREFAWEQFAASGDAEAMRRRHARYFARLAEEAEPHLHGLDCRRWLDRLDREHDNLRAALEWCRESGEAEVGLRLGTSLIDFWEVRGHWAEGRERMRRLLALPGSQKRTAARARALLGLFWLALRLGDLSEAGALGEEGLAIYREIGDPWGIAYGLQSLGSLARRHGRAGEARALLEESLAIRRKIGDDRGIGASLFNLGAVAGMQGDREAAAAFFEASLAVGRKIGSVHLTIGALNRLAHLAHGRDDFVTARALCEESLAVSRAAGDQLGLASSLGILACVACEQGDAAAARHACEESLAIRRRLGNRSDLAGALLVAGQIARHQPDAEGAEAFHREGLSIYEELEDTEGIARALWFLGHVARDRGDLAGSAALFRQSLALFREDGDGEGIAQLLEEFASLAARQGQMTRAARLLGAGAAVARTIGVTQPVGLSGEYRHTSAAVRAALDDPTFTAAWAEGEAMPLEQACAHALEGDPACGSPLTPDRHRSNG